MSELSKEKISDAALALSVLSISIEQNENKAQFNREELRAKLYDNCVKNLKKLNELREKYSK